MHTATLALHQSIEVSSFDTKEATLKGGWGWEGMGSSPARISYTQTMFTQFAPI